MCELEIFRKLKLYIPFLIVGFILIIGSALIISLGIARQRVDVWVGGILLAIFALPLFLFGLVVFCLFYLKESKNPKIFNPYPKSFMGLTYHAPELSYKGSEKHLLSQGSEFSQESYAKANDNIYKNINMEPLEENPNEKEPIIGLDENDRDYRYLEPL